MREAKVFLVFVLHGICLLFGSDLLRAWRTVVPHGPVWTGIEDVLFWFGAGVWSFILVFLFQDGQLRLYMAAAAGGGMLLYRKIAGENGWRGAFPGSSVCRFGFFLFFGKKSTSFVIKLLQSLPKKDKLKLLTGREC